MNAKWSVVCAALAAVGTAAGARVRLDAGWTFARAGETPRAVTVPHDWSIESAPDEAAETTFGGGFYPAGKGTYARTLTLTADEAAAPDLALAFECVYRDAAVFVNDAP